MDILNILVIIIGLLIIVPAALLSLIRVFTHPINEIISLWSSLYDQIYDIVQSIKLRLK